jgi:hypothetical protein
VLLARGAYLELSVQAAWRLALALLTTMFALRWLPAPAAVAFSLLLVEGLTLGRSAVLGREHAGPAEGEGAAPSRREDGAGLNA